MKKYNVSSKERIFHWTGISRLGEPMLGQITAANKEMAEQKLRTRDLIVRSIIVQHQRTRPLKTRQIMHCMEQWTRLMTAQLTLLQALDIVTACQVNRRMLALLHSIKSDLAAGASLFEALQHHPEYFDPLVCALIRMGEETGTLAKMMAQIKAHLSAKVQLQEQLKTVMTYPLAVLTIAILVTTALLTMVVPQFQALFQNFEAELPLATRIMIALSFGLKHYGLGSICLSFSGAASGTLAYKHCIAVTRFCDRLLLKIPGIGRLCQAIYLARSFHALAITNQAGLPLCDALQWVAPVAGNLCFKEAFLHMRTALLQGDSLRYALFSTELFPELVLQMLNIGEASGTMQDLCGDIGRYYSQYLEHALARFSRLIEPSLMLLLGLLVGGLVIAMYLPMLRLGAFL